MEHLPVLKICASLCTKQQVQKMQTSSYVSKYKEINSISVKRIHESGSFLSHHSYSPSFPTSGGIAHINAQTDLMSVTIVGYKKHRVIAKFSFCEPELVSPVSASGFSSSMCRKETVQNM